MADTLVALPSVSLQAEIAEFGQPSHTVVGSAATGANTATFTAVAVGANKASQWLAYMIVVSFAATTTSASTLTVTDGVGGTVIFQVELPTLTNPSPIVLSFGNRPLRATPGNALQAALSTPGSIKSAISMTGRLVSPP